MPPTTYIGASRAPPWFFVLETVDESLEAIILGLGARRSLLGGGPVPLQEEAQPELEAQGRGTLGRGKPPVVRYDGERDRWRGGGCRSASCTFGQVSAARGVADDDTPSRPPRTDWCVCVQ